MTEVAKRTPMQEVIATVRGEQFAVQLRNALPSNVTVERFQRVTVTALNQNPELITADRQSLYNSIIRCAQDGLLPDGREAALVIFSVKGEKKSQYLPMVGGLRKVAAKHQITLNAFVVYANDEFDYTLGENPHVHHKPPRLGEERGDPIGAYAVATYQDGSMVCPPEVMSQAEIEKVRAVSKAAKSEYGPWVNWWDQMARKTVARRLFKQLPLGDLDEMAGRIVQAVDAESEFGGPAGMTVDEANASASLPTVVPEDGGPVDEVYEPVEGEIVEEQMAAKAQSTAARKTGRGE